MTAPVRVLDLRDSPWLDGPGRTILQCASMVDTSRCIIEVGVLCTDPDGEHDYLRAARASGAPVVPIIERRSLDIGLVRQLVAAIRARSIAILHTHDFRSNLFGLIAAKCAGIPVVATCHGWIANTKRRQLVCRLDQWLLRWFDRVVAVSDYMAGQISEFGVSPERIAVIRNALVVEDYSPGADPSFRDELKLPADARLVALIGRLSPEKGQELFLRAARHVLESHPACHFVLIGIGPEQERLLALANELGLRERVHFVGFRTDMVRIYRSLDLVVQSSFTEGMPNVILEALLMEVPVAATRVGGTAEIVEPVCAQWLVEPGDQQHLVQTIATILEQLPAAKERARRGRQFVAEHFNHNRRVALLTELYEAVRGRR